MTGQARDEEEEEEEEVISLIIFLSGSITIFRSRNIIYSGCHVVN